MGRYTSRGKHHPIPVVQLLAVLLIVAGVGVIAYPHLQRHRYERQAHAGYAQYLHQTAAPTQSVESAAQWETQTPSMLHSDLWERMRAYNENLYAQNQSGLNSIQAYQSPSFQLTDYGFADAVFGYIQIPAIDVLLPVYLGASEENMKLGATHLSQTSLPIGGENCNSVICAHTGYPGAILFDNLRKLQPGDSVVITNPWETLSYVVQSTTTILEDEFDTVKIQPGKDRLTLFTCVYQETRRDRYVVSCERSG